MRRALLNAKFPINHLLTTPRSSSTPIPNTQISPSFSYPSKFRFFSSLNENPSTVKPNPNSESTTISPSLPKDFKLQDVSTKGFPGRGLIGLGIFPELQQMHPETLIVMRDITNLLNNADVLLDKVMNDSKIREEFIDQNPEIGHKLNNPVLRQIMEALRIKALKTENMLEMMRTADQVLRRFDENNQTANSNLFPADLGGGDLGGAETTTGSSALSTDPLPDPWAAAADDGLEADHTSANTTLPAADQVSSVEPGGSPFLPELGLSDLGMFPEFEQMHPKTLNMMREYVKVLKNPEVLFDKVMNDPKFRELVDKNPSFVSALNDPALRQSMEDLRNEAIKTENLRKTMRIADRVFRVIDINNEKACPGLDLSDLGLFLEESEHMHPGTLNLAREYVKIMNKPHGWVDLLLSFPEVREFFDQKRGFRKLLNDPVLRQKLEDHRNQELKSLNLRKLMRTTDQMLRLRDEIVAVLGGGVDLDGAAQIQEANPAAITDGGSVA